VFFRIGVLWLCVVYLSACSMARVTPTPTVAPPTPLPLPTLFPTPDTLPAATAAPAQPTPPPDTGWLLAAPGIELRRLRPPVAPAPVSIVRIDPTQARFRIGYDPAAPQSIEDWAQRTGAVAVINGGFFDVGNTTTALLVQNGVAVGESYVGRGGMFTVGPDEQVGLRSLADAPYTPGEPLAQALQGWPLLVRPGGEATYTYEDGDRARRSAIALDQAGNVLLIASAVPAFTLAEFSTWLAGADLGITTAINLDGGSSTGLLLQSDSAGERISPFIALPIVLLVLPNEG
jgi:hypothetical protein